MSSEKRKRKDQSYLGFELIEVDDYYLLSNTEKLLETVKEDWFKSLMDELRKVIGNYYPEFIIYLAYVNHKKDGTILGYVNVRKEDNGDEEHSDVDLNKAMMDICLKYDPKDTLFVTIQRKRKSFNRLKKGSVREHFKEDLLKLWTRLKIKIK